jgi:hypothetical protein
LSEIRVIGCLPDHFAVSSGLSFKLELVVLLSLTNYSWGWDSAAKLFSFGSTNCPEGAKLPLMAGRRAACGG